MTKTDLISKWNKEENESFFQIKESIMKSPTLRSPDYEK